MLAVASVQRQATNFTARMATTRSRRGTRSDVPDIPDEDVAKNAEMAAAELRVQISEQMAQATLVDTKAAAIITVDLAVAGFVATRLQLDDLGRVLAGAVALVAFLAVAYPALLALRPRDGFSFGAEPQALVTDLEHYSHAALAVSFAHSLAEAREKNVGPLRAKQTLYQRSLGAAVFLHLAIALLVVAGAVK